MDEKKRSQLIKAIEAEEHFFSFQIREKFDEYLEEEYGRGLDSIPFAVGNVVDLIKGSDPTSYEIAFDEFLKENYVDLDFLQDEPGAEHLEGKYIKMDALDEILYDLNIDETEVL